MDYVGRGFAGADADNIPAGKIVILPSSFNGSPRHMYQNYQDAMSIVRAYGKPDLFITFTCNPTSAETQCNNKTISFP